MSYRVQVEISDMAMQAKSMIVLPELDEQQLRQLKLDIGELFRQGAIFVRSTVAPFAKDAQCEFDSEVYQRRNATPCTKVDFARLLRRLAWHSADQKEKEVRLTISYRPDV